MAKTYNVYYYPRGARFYETRLQVNAENAKTARAKVRALGYTGGHLVIEPSLVV